MFPGRRQINLAASNLGARTMAIYGLPDVVCNLMSERSRWLSLIRFAHAKPAKRPWTVTLLSHSSNPNRAQCCPVSAARGARCRGWVVAEY